MERLEGVRVLHLGDGYGAIEERAGLRRRVPCFIYPLEYIDATTPRAIGLCAELAAFRVYVGSRRARCQLWYGKLKKMLRTLY